MSVVQASIQTVEEIYGILWAAVANKRPIEAVYHELPDCFVRTDWAETNEDGFECFAISMAAKARADSIRQVRLLTGVVWLWKSCAK
jgi:hypothetical protein